MNMNANAMTMMAGATQTLPARKESRLKIGFTGLEMIWCADFAILC
jgi:hypothetical protein